MSDSAFNELFSRPGQPIHRMIAATELLNAYPPEIIDSTIPGDPGPHVICRFPVAEPEDPDLCNLYITAGQQALIGYLGADFFDPLVRIQIAFSERRTFRDLRYWYRLGRLNAGPGRAGVAVLSELTGSAAVPSFAQAAFCRGWMRGLHHDRNR